MFDKHGTEILEKIGSVGLLVLDNKTGYLMVRKRCKSWPTQGNSKKILFAEWFGDLVILTPEKQKASLLYF